MSAPDYRQEWHSRVLSVVRFEVRHCGLDPSVDTRCGHFIEQSMVRVIRDYSLWLDYPSDRTLWLNRHKGDIPAMVFSDDGRYLFTASYDRRIICWDVSHTPSLVKEWTFHEGRVNCLDCSRHLLVSGGSDGLIAVWNARLLSEQWSTNGAIRSIESVVLNRDASLILCGSRDWTLRVWSVRSRKCMIIWNGHSKCIWSAVFLDSHRVISASDDRSVRVWRTDDTKNSQVICEGCERNPNHLDVSCDGSLMAFRVYSRMISVHRTDAGFTRMKTIPGDFPVVVFHPRHSRALAMADRSERSLKIMDALSAEVLFQCEVHSGRVATAICFTPDGSRLICVFKNQSILFCDVSSVFCS